MNVLSKAILILDEMPSSCIECPCRNINLKDEDICNCLFEDDNKLNLYNIMHRRPSWCPLKELPEKKSLPENTICVNGYQNGVRYGWNACIDEILNDEKE